MSTGRDGGAAVAWALRLSMPDLPGSGEPEDAPWAAAHAVARRERLAALAWHRSRSLITRDAPPTVAAAWRADAAAEMGRAVRRSAELRALLDVLGAAGVDPIVLKGLPLSERLYGSIELRPSADIDLHVDAARRAEAHAALLAAGWSHLSGESPDEGIYVAERAATGRQLLEVHSHLADDALLRHLRPPAPESARAIVDGQPMRVQVGDFVPAYLAVEHAKHASSPLLWLIDFMTLWSQLDAAARERALRSARGAGAHRYLARMLRLVEALPDAACADAQALARLGVRADGELRRGHNAARVAALAPSPLAAARVALAWAWPNDQGRGLEFLARRATRAVAALGRRVARTRRVAPANATRASERTRDVPPDSARVVDGVGLVDAVRTIVGEAGGSLWTRAHGGSMTPAVPSGARIELVPLGTRGVRRDDVVFAVTARGALVHRVVARFGDRVVLQGDAMAWSDPPARLAQVLARVRTVETERGVEPIDARPRPSPWRRMRRAPRQLGVLVGVVTATPGHRGASAVRR